MFSKILGFPLGCGPVVRSVSVYDWQRSVVLFQKIVLQYKCKKIAEQIDYEADVQFLQMCLYVYNILSVENYEMSFSTLQKTFGSIPSS